MALYYKSFTIPRPDYLGSGNWVLSDLNDISVIFGKNGSGKSILLRNLRDTDKSSFHYASPERAGDLSYNAGYVHEEQSGEARAGKRNRNLAPTYREEVIARIQAFLARRGNQRTRSTSFSPSEIEKMLHILMPEFQFQIRDGNPPFVLSRTSNSQNITTVNELSSGESQVLTLALDLLLICAMWRLEKRKKTLLLIDEPDSHLHPDLQQHLANFLVKVVEQYKVQMIITSHSTTLLSALGYHGQEKTSIVYLNNIQSEHKASKFSNILQELATCLGGHALMGPLFNAPLLLVEGDDDYRIWSQVPRHGVIRLAVIPCRGTEIDAYRKSLESIFKSLLSHSTEPSGYVLKDGDKTCSDQNFVHVKCVKLECHESENLYLCDEVLNELGITWDIAKTQIKNESGKFGNKKQKLDDADKWDRKTEDIKDVILELSQILDSKNVHWTLRVGKCIGEKKPTGQLADFLGNGVVEAFWT